MLRSVTYDRAFFWHPLSGRKTWDLVAETLRLKDAWMKQVIWGIVWISGSLEMIFGFQTLVK